MIVPTTNPYIVSLMALASPAAMAPTPPTQAVTRRPPPPPGRSEQPEQRHKRDRDEPEGQASGGRGSSTNLVV